MPDLVLVRCGQPKATLAVALERRGVVLELCAARREHARLDRDEPGRPRLRLLTGTQRAVQSLGNQCPVAVVVDRELDVDAGLLGYHHQLLRDQLRIPAADRQRVDQPARPGQRPFGRLPVLGQLLRGGQPEQDVDMVLSDPAAHTRGILLLLSLQVAAWAEQLSHVS
jgi:hypothetical protein